MILEGVKTVFGGRNLAPMNAASQLSIIIAAMSGREHGDLAGMAKPVLKMGLVAYSSGPSTTPSLVVVLPNLRSRYSR